jgi:hypothetical protein
VFSSYVDPIKTGHRTEVFLRDAQSQNASPNHPSEHNGAHRGAITPSTARADFQNAEIEKYGEKPCLIERDKF